jgi:hypothetical protein
MLPGSAKRESKERTKVSLSEENCNFRDGFSVLIKFL